MLFPEVKTALQSLDERAINNALRFLYTKQRNGVNYQVFRMGCKDTALQAEIFNRALIELKRAFEENKFKGNSFPELTVWLKKTATRLWGKHKENPEREAIKRGRYGDKDFKSNRIEFKIFDPQESSQVTKIVHTIEDESSIEDQEIAAQLSVYVGHVIDNMEGHCPERIRLSKYYVPDDRGADESIRSTELAEKFGDSSPTAARKALLKCKKKLRAHIMERIQTNAELRELLSNRIKNFQRILDQEL